MTELDEIKANLVYDEMASCYGYDVEGTSAGRIKFQLARKYINAGDRVLDVGCANGIYLLPLARVCKYIHGVDLSAKMLGEAKKKIEEDGFSESWLHKQNVSALGFLDNSFDVVYCFSTLPWVMNPAKSMKESIRVLRSGGVAIFDIAGAYNLSQVYWTRFYKKRGHFGLNVFSYKEIKNLLMDMEVEILEQHALGFTDQWHYIPGIHLMKFLDGFFHGSISGTDRDYRISNKPYLFPFANRWYIVCRKQPQ